MVRKKDKHRLNFQVLLTLEEEIKEEKDLTPAYGQSAGVLTPGSHRFDSGV